MGSTPTAGILCFILLCLLWCRLLCQAQRLYSSVVKRQFCKLKVLGLTPSGGYYFVAGIVVCRLLVIQFCVWRCSLRSSALLNKGIWRNGSASDSRSEGWGFESLTGHFFPFSGGRRAESLWPDLVGPDYTPLAELGRHDGACRQAPSRRLTNASRGSWRPSWAPIARTPRKTSRRSTSPRTGGPGLPTATANGEPALGATCRGGWRRT